MRQTTRYLPPGAPNKLPAQPGAKLDNDWTTKELIPFLVAIWGEPHEGYWDEIVTVAAESTCNLPIYEDFESTVERFRLLLVNPDTLTNAERKDFGSLRDDTNLCIAVFVRHFLNHGPYKLHSLGSGPNPDHPRQKVTAENRHTYIYGGRMSRKRGDTHWTSRKPHLQQHPGRDRPAPINDRRNSIIMKGSVPQVGKSQGATAVTYMSKNKAPQTIKDRRGHAPVQSRTQSRTSSARPFANPAFDGPGVHLRDKPHIPIPGVTRYVQEPMPMQDPSRMYQQWDSSRTLVQPYTAPPHHNGSPNHPTFSQDNGPYETSYEFEHARPVAPPFNGDTDPHYHQGQTSTSRSPFSAIKTSVPGPQIGTEVVDPSIQPSRGAQQLRMTASDFVPGVSKHNF